MAVGQNTISLTMVVELIEAQNDINLPVVVDPIEAQNKLRQSAHCGRAH